MFSYHVYKLSIASELKLFDFIQESKENTGSVDCYIKKMTIDPEKEKLYLSHVNFSYSEKSVWFANSEGHFYVENGNTILVAPREGSSEIQIAAFICGWCIAFIFSQRNHTSIHSSAIEISEDSCLLVSGDSGAGKSTTTFELLKRGYRFLADDIAIFNPLTDFKVLPSFPIQKVCRDRVEELEKEVTFYIDEGKDKFAYINKEKFCFEERELTHVVILKKGKVDKVEARELYGMEKYKAVLKSLFLHEIYKGLGIPNDEKFRCLKVAEKVRIMQIVRPVEGNTTEEIGDLIVSFASERLM